MKRGLESPHFESSLVYPHEESRGLDVSKDSVDAVETAVSLEHPEQLLDPQEMAVQAFERFIQRKEYKDSAPGLRDELGNELLAFGCSEKETGQIQDAIMDMDNDDKAVMIEGGELGRHWSVEKVSEGEYKIEVQVGNEEREEGSTLTEGEAEDTIPALSKELSEPDTDEQDEKVTGYDPTDEMGLVLEQHADEALDVGDISNFQKERQDFTDEDPARRASSVLAQNSNSIPE